ncbi:MAG TPA: MFS transporter, partial [Bacteroidales bacterium]|nr:MFS transporter [Bacteroidales bacterium]
VPLLEKLGLAVTPIFMIPGLMIGLLLWFSSRHLQLTAQQGKSLSIVPDLKQHWRELSKIMGIVALRSLTYFSLISFLPLYLRQSGISLVVGSRLVFLMLFAGSLGGLAGGMLADMYGRKRIAVISLCIASPLFYFFSVTSGMVSIVLLGLAGAFLLATFSVTVTLAHKEIEKNAGLASGLMLGFGTGIGGLGVGLLGRLADIAGISLVVNILFWLPLAGGLLAFKLKNE